VPLARVLRDPGVLAAVSGTLQAGTASNVAFSPALDRTKRFSARIEPVELGEQGGSRGVLVTLREQTEQVMIERMRSDFVANASHEIRNPLAAIQGIIETLRGPARHDPKARDMFLEVMAGEAARMARLVDDLLSLSRTELSAHQPPTERCDLAGILGQVLERMRPAAAATAVRIESEIAPGLPELVADRTSSTSCS
jgi:two-component system phosphate regulon sensor histidine kinase PhoR